MTKRRGTTSSRNDVMLKFLSRQMHKLFSNVLPKKFLQARLKGTLSELDELVEFCQNALPAMQNSCTRIAADRKDIL